MGDCHHDRSPHPPHAPHHRPGRLRRRRGALSLTACQGTDQDAAGSSQKKDSAASHSTGEDKAASGGSSSDSSSSGGSSSASGKTPKGEHNGTPVADSTESKAASPVRTQTLVDGSTAEIYRSGDQNYRAEIVNGGERYGTLRTHDADDGANFNGMYLVLTMGGKVHSWTGGEQQGPGTFDLEGGWKAEVTKLGQNRYARRSWATTVRSTAPWRRTRAPPGPAPTACTSCSPPVASSAPTPDPHAP